MRSRNLKRMATIQMSMLIASLFVVAITPSAAAINAPPLIDVRSVGEFEKSDYLLLKWGGGGVIPPIHREIIRGVEDSVQVYLICDSSTDMSSAQNYLASQGIPLVNVTFLVYLGNSIWMRDYGPNFVMYPNGSIAMVDLHYYDSRPQDDAFPNWFSGYAGYDNYVCDLYFEGGNYMSDGVGESWSTNEIFLDNPSLPQAQVSENITDYFGANAHKTLTKQSGDGTGHIDMFAKLVDVDKVLVAQFPVWDTNYQITENNVQYLENQTASNGNPFTIYRIPTIRNGGTFNTYTNSLIVNNRVLLPVYNLPEDSIAVATYQQAMPGYEIISIDCSGMISWGGAIHCITMPIPGHDITPPDIKHTPADPTPVYTPINITAQVSDDVRVKSVWLTYTDVHGAPHNESMQRWSHDNFSFDIPAQDRPGTLSYKIIAEDCARITTTDINNWKGTSLIDVHIMDMLLPTIEHEPITTTTVSDPVEITALVIDDFELATVSLNYTDINGTDHIVPMILGATLHSGSIPAQGYFGMMNYSIEAWDADGNFNTTPQYQLSVEDMTPPEISLFPPSTSLTGQSINITATVTDDVGIDEVVLLWSPPTGGRFNYSMKLLDQGPTGWTFAVDIPSQDSDGNLNCHAGVADLAGHWSFSPTYIIVLEHPNRPPEIFVPRTLTVLEDSWMNITIEAFDPDIDDELTFEVESPLAKYHGLTFDPNTREMCFLPSNEHVGTWQLNLSVTDFDGLISKCSTNLTVLNTNDPPVLFTQDVITGEEDSPIIFMISATDEDLLVGGEDILSITNTGSTGTGVSVQIEPQEGQTSKRTAEVSLTLPENYHGAFDLSFEVDDGQGGKDSGGIQIIVVPIQDPPRGGGIAYPGNGTSFPNGTSVSFIANEATDPDDDPLEYMWESDVDGILGWGVNLSAHLTVGNHNITLTISDGTSSIVIPSIVVAIEPPEDEPDVTDEDEDDGLLSGDGSDLGKNEEGGSSLWMIIAVIIAISVAALLLFLLVYPKKRREEGAHPYAGGAALPPPVATPTSAQIMVQPPSKGETLKAGSQPSALRPAPLALPAAKETASTRVAEPPQATPATSTGPAAKEVGQSQPVEGQVNVAQPAIGTIPSAPAAQPIDGSDYPKYRRN